MSFGKMMKGTESVCERVKQKHFTHIEFFLVITRQNELKLAVRGETPALNDVPLHLEFS